MADGEPIDWEELRQRPGASGAEAVLANLLLIDRHGRSRRAPAPPALSHPSIPGHLKLLLALVTAQTAVGLLSLAVPSASGVPPWLAAGSAVTFSSVAAGVLVFGRWDSRAAPLAGLFLTLASAIAQPLLARVAAAAGPAAGPAALLGAALPEAFLPFFLWRFVQRFPKVLHFERRGGWFTGARTLSLLVGSLLFAANAFHRLAEAAGSPGAAAWLPSWSLRGTTSLYWLWIFLLSLPAPAVLILRARHAGADERRRVKAFLAGLAVGVLPLFLAASAEVAFPAWAEMMSDPAHRRAGSFLVYGFLLTVPFTTAYASVARQVLGLRFTVHRATRFLLAKSTLWLLSAVPWGAALVYLWRSRDLPLAEALHAPALVALLALGALGLLLGTFRRRLLEQLERRLLGGPTTASRSLAALHQALPAARDLGELGALARRYGRELLHAESCHLFVRRASGELAPAGSEGRALPADSAVACLAEASPQPMSFDPRAEDGWLPWIPEADRLWMADTQTQLLVPVRRGEDPCAALLSIGAGRSGRPFRPDEREAASALGSALGLALERLLGGPASQAPDAEAAADGPAGECPSCLTVGPAPGAACGCGAVLAPASIPHRPAGKFELERVLGEGGMGRVYLARDLTLGRLVALKTLPRLRSDALLRLRREARSMAALTHPNLATIFGAETWKGVPILVVEYLAEGTLAGRVGRSSARALSPAEVVEVGVGIGGALDAMHQRGFLHRDVKPANIGFASGGEAKLLDFGLATLIEEVAGEGLTARPAEDLAAAAAGEPALARLTQTGYLVGTPLYLSPEALRGARPSPEQDLWSLHLSLWEALAGAHPMADLPPDAALERLARGALPDLRALRPDCPAALAETLGRGLSPEPAERPRSAGAVVAELRRLAAALPG